MAELSSRRLRWLVPLVGAILVAAVLWPWHVTDTAPPPDDDTELLQQLGYVDWHAAIDPDDRGVTRHLVGRASPGYDLYTNLVDEVRLEDLDGRLVHLWRLPGKADCEHAELLPDGLLAVVCVNDGIFVLDWDSSVRWHFDAPVHHDLAPLANGGFVVLVRGEERFYRGRFVAFDDVVELAADGRILRSWSTWDALPGLRAFIPASGLDAWPDLAEWVESAGTLLRGDDSAFHEYFHSNAIELVPENSLGRHDPRFAPGGWLVSLRNANTLVILDRTDLSVVWHWGNGVLDMQHTPTVLDDGHVLVFDNGTERGFSRVLEVDPEDGEIVWRWQADPPEALLSKWQGSSQRLPNGDTLICESTAGHVVEVAPSGEIVWEFWNPEIVDGQRRGIYRMQRLPTRFVEDLLERHAASPVAAD